MLGQIGTDWALYQSVSRWAQQVGQQAPPSPNTNPNWWLDVDWEKVLRSGVDLWYDVQQRELALKYANARLDWLRQQGFASGGGLGNVATWALVGAIGLAAVMAFSRRGASA